jgi:ATP-dependent RNA helicase DeaD
VKTEQGMVRYRIEVGHDHEVKPANIVGAIANEAGIDSKNIGRIDILDDHSLLDLPEGMPREILKKLKKVWVSGQQLQISALGKDRNLDGDSDSRKTGKEKTSARTRAKTRARTKANTRKEARKKDKKKTKNKSGRL